MVLVGLVVLVGSVGLAGLTNLLGLMGLIGLGCHVGLIVGIFLAGQKCFQIEILSLMIQKNLMIPKYLRV